WKRGHSTNWQTLHHTRSCRNCLNRIDRMLTLIATESVSLLVSYNLCSVWVVRAATGNQGCHSYSPVAHRPRNTRPEKAGSFLSVIVRETIIGGHGNGFQLHPKLASFCRFRAALNRYRFG